LKKDKSNPLLEEKVVRLQELAMQTRDQLDAHIMDFSRKIAQFSTTMISTNQLPTNQPFTKLDPKSGNYVQYSDFQFT
jgi:hypothetical protein